MSIVNPYEPSQLAAMAPRVETLPTSADDTELSEREFRVFATQAQHIAAGARYWLLGLAIHHGFALAGYSMYIVDWAKGERTGYRYLGFGIILIGIVISLFVSAAGQLQLTRWPRSLGARWWFRAAFACFVVVMVLSIGDLMLTLKYRENRDPVLWEVIELERPTLLLTRCAMHALLALGLLQVGRLLQDRKLRICGGLAALGAILFGLAEARFELLGSTTQVLREVTFLEPLEQAAVIAPWLLLTVPLVVAMFRLYRRATHVVKITPAEEVDDPLVD